MYIRTCFLSCSLTPLVSPLSASPSLSDLASLSPSHPLPVPCLLPSPHHSTCLPLSPSPLLLPSSFLQMAADVQVAKLMEMGFNREDVLKALTSNNLNFESALGERTVTQDIQSCGTSGSDSEAGKTCPVVYKL